jgi:uncharacterized membrane protein
MSAVAALAVGALATWVLRTTFIALVPADRLHPRVRRTLRHVGPAVLGAMIVTLVVGHGGLPALVTPSARHLAAGGRARGVAGAERRRADGGGPGGDGRRGADELTTVLS